MGRTVYCFLSEARSSLYRPRSKSEKHYYFAYSFSLYERGLGKLLTLWTRYGDAFYSFLSNYTGKKRGNWVRNLLYARDSRLEMGPMTRHVFKAQFLCPFSWRGLTIVLTRPQLTMINVYCEWQFWSAGQKISYVQFLWVWKLSSKPIFVPFQATKPSYGNETNDSISRNLQNGFDNAFNTN